MVKEYDEKTKDVIKKHVAGAGFQHRSEFSTLEVLKNDEPINQEFRRKFVIPFYLPENGLQEFISSYLKIRSEVNLSLVKTLLGESSIELIQTQLSFWRFLVKRLIKLQTE